MAGSVRPDGWRRAHCGQRTPPAEWLNGSASASATSAWQELHDSSDGAKPSSPTSRQAPASVTARVSAEPRAASQHRNDPCVARREPQDARGLGIVEGVEDDGGRRYDGHEGKLQLARG